MEGKYIIVIDYVHGNLERKETVLVPLKGQFCANGNPLERKKITRGWYCDSCGWRCYKNGNLYKCKCCDTVDYCETCFMKAGAII